MSSPLTSVDTDLWILARPQVFMGLHFGTHMTVVRLEDGSLWVHSPVALDDELRAALDALGPVRNVIAPNLYHHVYAGSFAAAFDGARLHAPAGLAKKRPDLKIDATLGDTPDPAWAGQIDQVFIAGTLMEETIFFHRATRSLIVTDLLENFETSDHWFTRTYLKMAGIHGKPGLSRMLRMVYRDRKTARACLDRILEWDFQRICLPHGDLLTDDPKEALRQAYAWLTP